MHIAFYMIKGKNRFLHLGQKMIYEKGDFFIVRFDFLFSRGSALGVAADFGVVFAPDFRLLCSSGATGVLGELTFADVLIRCAAALCVVDDCDTLIAPVLTRAEEVLETAAGTLWGGFTVPGLGAGWNPCFPLDAPPPCSIPTLCLSDAVDAELAAWDSTACVLSVEFRRPISASRPFNCFSNSTMPFRSMSTSLFMDKYCGMDTGVGAVRFTSTLRVDIESNLLILIPDEDIGTFSPSAQAILLSKPSAFKVSLLKPTPPRPS